MEKIIQKRKGSRYPHWTRDNAIYAITYRLADSIPRKKRDTWLLERKDIVAAAKRLGRPLSEQEQRRLDELYSEKVERYLQAGNGVCWLQQEEIARIVTDAFVYFEDIRYALHAWCIMPNHIHVVVQPYPEYSLEGIIHSWKSYTAKRANTALNRTGEFWCREYYDHLIRDEQELRHSVGYTWNNPEKAGLREWKWRWVRDEHLLEVSESMGR